MIERVEQRFELSPERLIGDMAYGAADFLGWMVNEKAIEPHVPVWDKTQRNDDTLSSSEFEWDEQANEYRCPQGQPLRSEWRAFRRPRTHLTQANTVIYRASQAACGKCPMKARCCPNTPSRKIARSVHESARDVARDIAKTDAYQQSARTAEGRNAVRAPQTDPEAGRLRLRGLSGLEMSFYWQRLRRTCDEWRSG